MTAPETPSPSISPARLNTIIAGLWICLFVAALDTTILTTSLVKIASSFDALEQAAWLITSYLLTYNSSLLVASSLSDIWGLRITMLTYAAIFLIFSMACGAAQSMLQLIVFRAFQGIGGSGLYSLTFVSIMKLIVPEKVGFYSGVISSVFAVANLLGPLLGGVISDRTTWRWIFFINGPVILIAMVLLFFSMPALHDGKSNAERVRGLDGIGGVLSVCWSIPLIFALQEAGVSHPWSSGVIIGTLVTGLILLIIFGLYESWVTYRTKIDAIFPVHFLRKSPVALLLLSILLNGMPFYVAFVQLPQRFQNVNFTTAERAGILLLPTTLMVAVGAMAGGLAANKLPAEYILIAASAMVCVATGLLSSLPTSSAVWSGIYGYQVLMGLGLGASSPPYYMLLATSIEEKDISVGTGALNMMRTFGGCVAVAICSAVHQEFLGDRLPQFLSPQQIGTIQSLGTSMAQLSPAVKERVGEVFGASFNRQFLVMLAFAALNLLVAVVITLVRWKKGVLGVKPERSEANEFTNVAEKRDDEEKAGSKTETSSVSAKPSAKPRADVDERSVDKV